MFLRRQKHIFVNYRFNGFERRRSEAAREINTGSKTMLSALRKYVANESGATAIEYALIASLIAVAIIASITVLGTQLQNTFNEVSSNLK